MSSWDRRYMYPQRDGGSFQHNAPYWWVNDNFRAPTGMSGDPGNFDMYEPFGVLDFSSGQGNYRSLPYGFGIDQQGRTFDNLIPEELAGWQNIQGNGMGEPAQSRWSNPLQHSRYYGGPRFSDPYAERGAGNGYPYGFWYSPQGGSFGEMDLNGGNSISRSNNHYLDSDDYRLPSSWLSSQWWG